MSKNLNEFVTRFAGGSASGLPPGAPGYQVNGRLGTHAIFSEEEAVAAAKAILKDVRERKKRKGRA